MGLPLEVRERVAAATVRLAKLGGQGVLVPGGYVLTVAHCIEWDAHGAMALGDYFLEPIETRSGARFRLAPCFADPMSDLAALGEPDSQELSDDCDAFESWRDRTDSIPLATLVFDVGESRPVHVLSHLGTWIEGKITRHGGGPGGRLGIDAEEPIRGGTSGGPIVDDDGRLVAIVSYSNEVPDGNACNGLAPVPALALPRWLADAIGEADTR